MRPEAESTLHVRVLTKDRSERQEACGLRASRQARLTTLNDADCKSTDLAPSALKHAKASAKGSCYNRTRSSKLPWKYIAGYIEELRWSYSFALGNLREEVDEL